MALKIAKLDESAASAMYKLLASSHKFGVSTLQVLSFKDYFLNDPNGIALGAFDDGKLVQLLLAGVEAHTLLVKHIHGKFGSHTQALIDHLTSHAAARYPELSDVAFVLTDDNRAEFHAAYAKSEMHMCALEENETRLRAGVRPTDKFTWEIALTKNVPGEDLNVFRIKIKWKSGA
jgi:hypothetical protein